MAKAKGSLTQAVVADKAAKEQKQPEPHEVNSALASPRMQALLAEHRAMGVRPK